MIQLILITLTLMLAGCGDYDDAVWQEATYCEMVSSGAWGAYNDSIDCTSINNDKRSARGVESHNGIYSGNEGLQGVR